MKRNRTPPTDQHESDVDVRTSSIALQPFGPCIHLLIKIKSDQEWELIVAPPPYEQAPSLRQPEEPVQDNSTPSKGDPHSIEQDISPVQEVRLPSMNRNSCPIDVLQPSLPVHPETSSRPEEKGEEAERCSTPQPPQVIISPNEPETPPARPITPPKPAAPTKIEPVKAFSAFSSSSTPFGLCSNASGVSPFALSGQTVKTTPAWRRNNESESDVFGRASSANALAPSPDDAVSSMTTKSQSKSALGVPGETQSLAKSSSRKWFLPVRASWRYVLRLGLDLTGEEDENVEAELKGVKLFVKRGRKEFTDGMYGHIKILSQKSMPPNIDNRDPQGAETATDSRTRLRKSSASNPPPPIVKCHITPPMISPLTCTLHDKLFVACSVPP